jgi:PPE-repeat protein
MSAQANPNPDFDVTSLPELHGGNTRDLLIKSASVQLAKLRSELQALFPALCACLLPSNGGFATENTQQAVLAKLGDIKIVSDAISIDADNIDLNTDTLEALITATNLILNTLEALITATNLILNTLDRNNGIATVNTLRVALTTDVQTLTSANVVVDGVVASGKSSVSFITDITFTGTINGLTRTASNQYTFTAAVGKTLPAIGYTIATGSIDIDTLT